MAHGPSLGFADYFSAADASAAEVATLMEPGMTESPEFFGLHAADMESFLGMRGLAAMPGAAHGHSSKAAVLIDAGQDGGGSATLRFIGEQHQQHHHHQQAPLSLSLCGPDGVGVTLHQQQQHLGDSSRHHHNQQHAAAWMQKQHDYDSPVTSHGQQLHGGGAWHLRGSRFLLPAQQLLHEFCSLPVGATSKQAKAKPPTSQQEDVGEVSSSSAAASLAPSAQIQGMEALELQRLKDKLYIMLEEVDRRYRRYCEQMRSVVGGFEAVAGERAAAAYTALASRTISRHFRSLRDGVVAQLQAVRRALGEKDVAAVPGMTRGDTPRLRVLDQCIRQQKALVQGGVMEAHPWRPQRGLPERAVTILRAWLFEHFLHPYPSDVDKHILARQTGLSRMQVSNWFINARVRLWKPMVEEMYVEEMKCDQQPADGGSGGGGGQEHGMNSANNPSCSHASEAHGSGGHVLDDDRGDHGDNGGDRKPTRAQLLHNAGSLAAVVNVGGVAHGGGAGAGGGARLENFGVMDHLDFDAYDGGGGGHHQGGFGGAGGVSLTLGLQQHDDGGGGAGGVNIAFGAPPPSAHHHHHGGPPPAYLFAAGGHHQQMEGGVHPSHGGHHVQFGATMDDVEAPPHGQAAEHYRTLSTAGFHLLRDLAG